MEKPKLQNININIVENKEFHADDVSILNNPLKFILDFKSSSPRLDMRMGEQGVMNIVLEHNVIKLDPYMAKSLHEMLTKNIGTYEKAFGKIEVPAALAKHRNENMPPMTINNQEKTSSPSYFG